MKYPDLFGKSVFHATTPHGVGIEGVSVVILPSGQFSLCNWVMVSLASPASLYRAPGHMVNASDFLGGIYIDILPPVMHIK